MKKRKILLFSIISFLIFFSVSASSYSDYDSAVKNTDTYITRFSRYKLFIDTTNLYLYNGTLSSKSGFNKGGFVNTYEFNSTLDGNESYLITGSKYFTMTENGSNVDSVYIRKISKVSKSSTIESRITEYVIPETKVEGEGSRTNPWTFIVPEFNITINLQNATIDGKTTFTEKIIGYTKTYTITPSKNYYAFKGNAGDISCNSGVKSYKVVDNKLILDDIVNDVNCVVKYRGIDVAADIIVNNGTAASTKLTGEAGSNLSTTLAANFGYAYSNVSCTNGQNASYASKTLTVNNVTSNTVCTVNYGVPSDVTYNYKNSNQTFTAPYDGYFKFDAYGAQGSGSGGKGAYGSATIFLNEGETVTINTGGTNGYNGGGSGLYTGGGASTVKKNGTIIVAAAGGGGGSAGTAGGSGTGAGGASSGGSGTNGGAGSSGSNAGGGGAGYNYTYNYNCSDCYYGSNTCRGGYDQYNCSSCYYGHNTCRGKWVETGVCERWTTETYNHGSGSQTFKCSGGQWWWKSSSFNVNCGSNTKYYDCEDATGSCTNGSTTTTSCWGYCEREVCSSYEEYYDDCYYGEDTCSYGCDEVYNSCQTGSNTCRYGCSSATNPYNSGKGGKNIFLSSALYQATTDGAQSGNGKVIVKFYSEEIQ